MNKQEILELLKRTEQAKWLPVVAEFAAGNELFLEKIKATLLPDEKEKLPDEKENDDDDDDNENDDDNGSVEICDIDCYKSQAENCFTSNQDLGIRRNYYDYFDYREAACNVVMDLNDMMDEARELIKQKDCCEAAAMMMAIAEVIPRNNEDVDDYDGELDEIFSTAIELLCDFVNSVDVSDYVKREIYKWSNREISSPVYSNYGFNELNTLYDLCCDKLGDTDEVLADIDRQISEAKNESSQNYAVLRKIRFMLSRNMDADTVILSNMHINGVRKIRFTQLFDAGKYDEAIHIANQGIESATNQNNQGTAMDWHKSIYDVYLAKGDTVNLLQTAEYLFLNAGWQFKREEFYNVLKTKASLAIWPATMERILTEIEAKSRYDALSARIMLEHQLWKRLFAYCQKGGIAEMEKYEVDLKPHLEAEILDYYHDYTEKKALITDQNAYLEVARILKRMKTFTNGNVLVNKLLEKYRIGYKRRKNMIAALKDL